MSAETDPGLWKQVSGWLWLVLAPLLGLVWGQLNKRIDEIKAKADGSVSKSEFDKFVEKQREDMKELFKRDDAIKDHVNARVETLRTDMHEAIGRLRDTMDQGFKDLRRELSDVLKAVNTLNSRRRE
jgi:hypothetical protein